ncbi:hypothetical protein EDB89DRAFT_394279 [Lactarius sanguifluus]|nr:hypothetical protein EDB89DRAFT_394279 [Lactarius sanguifluus]
MLLLLLAWILPHRTPLVSPMLRTSHLQDRRFLSTQYSVLSPRFPGLFDISQPHSSCGSLSNFSAYHRTSSNGHITPRTLVTVSLLAHILYPAT